MHISASALTAMDVKLPAAPEQAAIALILSDMDADLAALEAKRDKARAIKQGMMQALLTGAIRLTGQSDCRCCPPLIMSPRAAIRNVPC